MAIRPDLAVLALAGVAAMAAAETAGTDCSVLTAALQAALVHELTAPPAGPEAGWCVLDGARFSAVGDETPNLTAARLRLRGTTVDGVPESIQIDIGGLRVLPRIGDRTLDDRLRSLFRLQSADLRLTARVDADNDRLVISGGEVILSGGTEVRFAAVIAGANLAPRSILGGSLLSLEMEWRNDGRILRTPMAIWGEQLVDGPLGDPKVSAARVALRQRSESLPAALFADGSRQELAEVIAALPQGRGTMLLTFRSKTGLGAAQVGLAALSDDPFGPASLARLFAGSSLEVDWTPGIAP